MHFYLKLHVLVAQLSWSVSADPLTEAGHELCVHGNRVVWLEGLNPRVRTVKKVYSVESEILQAFWCQFRTKKAGHERKNRDTDTDGRDKAKRSGEALMCICVREQNCLTLFLQTGAVHHVPLPFLVS